MKNLFVLPALLVALGLLLTSRATAQNFTTLYVFTGGSDGGNPAAGLILSGNTLYGTAGNGGTIGRVGNGSGTVFAINTDGTGFKILYSFTAAGYDASSFESTNSDGGNPQGGLLLSGNALYGIASQAGTNGAGTVFAVNIGGTGFSVLHTFTENSDGANPDAGLILSGNTLYGTASTGGSSSSGTVFRVNTDGTDFTNLHSFSSNSGYPGYTNSDGFEPLAGLILSGHILFGTTFNGGSSGSGTVFKVNTDGTDFTNLHSFTAVNSLTETGTNSDGAHPFASLILSGNALYGTASQGGKASAGAVFKINTDGTGFTNLHSFINKPNTANPAGGLILSGNTLYGTAAGGGGSTCGTLFSINTNGTDFTTLYSLTGPSGYDGGDPVAALILSDGTVYGTTMLDGTVNGNEAGNGTVFSFVLPVPVPVLLTLTPYGTSIILTWPVSETGFTLQSTTNLVPPVIWSTVSGQFTVTNSVSGMQKFYRLSQ